MNLREIADILRKATDVEAVNDRREEIAEVIPKVRIMFDFDQKNNAHQYDLWRHSLHVALAMPRDMDDDMLYLGALLHDIGKPDSQCRGKKPDDPDMHYYGHPEKSFEIVRDEVLPDLEAKGYKLTKEEKDRLLYFVRYHDDRVKLDMESLKKHLEMVDFETFRKLMILQVADAKIHVQKPLIIEREEICSAFAGEVGRQMYESLDS
ncbi:MAG: HD domain-containing protein [Lachnospiraceae bacterium]|jgi:hypothetical protein|nr:HD domain-containing protein [Lachnospiraceae bacterium]